MKLFTEKYNSPIDTEGNFENVFIEDTYYNIDRINNILNVKFEMYYLKDSKRIVLDNNQLSFRGTNQEYEQGLPTTNKTAYIKIPASSDYISEQQITDEEGNVTTISAIGTPETVYPLKEYLYLNQGQFPEQYEVVEFGYPTYEDSLYYFTGGSLNNPEFILTNDFAKEWLKNTLQMKGQAVTNFEFIN